MTAVCKMAAKCQKCKVSAEHLNILSWFKTLWVMSFDNYSQFTLTFDNFFIDLTAQNSVLMHNTQAF